MRDIDLSCFCARNDPREHLRAPWLHKGWRYASNGHICVRAPSPESAGAIFEHKVAESAAGLFARCDHEDYAPLPAFKQGAQCGICKGVGQFRQSCCEDCDGEGEFTHGRHDYQCRECDGEGWLEDTAGELRDCNYCDGYGRERSAVQIGQVWYESRYLTLIRALPGVRFAPGDSTDIEKARPGHFIFTGGEGLLMPRSA